MLNTWKDLSEKISEILAPSDAEVLASEIESIKVRRESLHKEYDAVKAEGGEQRIGVWRAYDRYFAAAGGKTWFRILRDRSDIIEFITKNHERTIRARNEKFAFKLEKEGIVSIESGEQISEGRRFFGTWALETNSGRRVLTLEMILAGGYNIQCLHNRTLLKIRATK